MGDWQRLGEEIVKRRVELGVVSREEFARQSRLSTRILAYLEHGNRTSYDRTTLVRLERALRWVPGSVQAVLDGAAPTALPDEPPPLHVHGPDEWTLMSLLTWSGLSPEDVQRIIGYIKVRRAQQRDQLVGEVRDLIREAGGMVPPRPRTIEQSADNAPHLYPGEGVARRQG